MLFHSDLVEVCTEPVVLPSERVVHAVITVKSHKQTLLAVTGLYAYNDPVKGKPQGLFKI